MVSRLRKAFVVLFMVLAILAGAFGWSGNVLTVSAYQNQHTSSQHLLATRTPRINCPPPPYEC